MANPEMHTAVRALLHRLSDRWTDFDRDQLTTTDAQALRYLIAAEFVERRTGLRLRMRSTSDAVEASLAACFGVLSRRQSSGCKVTAE